MTRYPVLKIDIDGRRRLPLVELIERARRAFVTIVTVVEQRSPSGRGWHQWITIDPPAASAVEVAALQLLFGSDPYREAYVLHRARRVDAGELPPFFAARFNVFYSHTYPCKQRKH